MYSQTTGRRAPTLARWCATLALVTVAAGCRDGETPTGPRDVAEPRAAAAPPTVTQVPPCRSYDCDDGRDGRNPEPSCRGSCPPAGPTSPPAGEKAGGTGTGSAPTARPKRNSKCISATAALATATAVEANMRGRYAREKGDYTRAGNRLYMYKASYTYDGTVTAEERAHLDELERTVEEEMREMKDAEGDWGVAKVALEVAKATWVVLCVFTGPAN